MSDVIIRFSHVSKSFGKLKVLDNFSFEVKKGERISIFGPTGIGKTTILKMIAGILKPDKGFVEVKRTVGYVFQEPRLLPWKTALENINLVVSDEEKARKWLNKVGLEGFENYYPKSLSGGMKQKVALARALAIEPSILLLDEAFTGLDFKTKDEIFHLLMNFLDTNKSTAVYISHNMEEISNFTDNILVLPYSNGLKNKNNQKEVKNMEKAKIIIDVRNMSKVTERRKKVSAELNQIESGEYAEIIADDERMLKLAPQMIKNIGKSDFIKSWTGEDGFFHTLIKRK